MSKPLFTNVMVVITGSDASISAAKYAIVMAKTHHCKVFALYVVDTATIKQLVSSRIFVPEEGLEYENNLKANGERYLSFVEELAKAKGVKVEREIRKGAVDSEILAAADAKKADVIVLGGWEKDRNSRDLIIDTRDIMMNAKCSVILVKNPNIDQIYRQA